MSSAIPVRACPASIGVPVIDAEIFSLIRYGCVPGGTRANVEAVARSVDWGNTDEGYRTLQAQSGMEEMEVVLHGAVIDILKNPLITSNYRRMHLTRLSLAAVRELSAGSDIDAEELYRRTSGNPFFATEVIAWPKA